MTVSPPYMHYGWYVDGKTRCDRPLAEVASSTALGYTASKDHVTCPACLALLNAPYSRLMVQFRVLAAGGVAPCHGHAGDAGWDLVTSRQAVIPPHTFMDVHTDIAVQWPTGIWGRITGRSSTLRRRSLLVSEGIIDNGYTGELFVGVFNMTNEPRIIEVGDRVAQLVPHLLVPLVFVETQTDLGSADGRGTAGFGSTG